MDDEDFTRPPDKVKVERLIDDYEPLMPPVPPRRRRGRKPKTMKGESIGEFVNQENEIMHNHEFEDDHDYHNEIYGRVDEETRMAMELSEKEYINQMQESFLEEQMKEIEENIKKERAESLPEFRKRVQRLVFSEEDKKIKKQFDSAFELYSINLLDAVPLNEDEYKLLFDFIDSLYIVPLSNGRKTAIPENEYSTLKNIFQCS